MSSDEPRRQQRRPEEKETSKTEGSNAPSQQEQETEQQPESPKPSRQDSGWYMAESPFIDQGETSSGEPSLEEKATPPPQRQPPVPPQDIDAPNALDATVHMRPQSRPQTQPEPRPRPRPDQTTLPPPQRPAPRAQTPRPVPQRTGYVPAQRRAPSAAPPQRRPAPQTSHRPRTRRAPAPARRDFRGCLLRGVVASGIALLVLVFLGVAVAAVGYVYLARELPPAVELLGRQTQFVSSRIYDRDGSLLWELIDPQGGRRTRVTLDQVSQHVIDATVATEDETFWEHRGFSPFAIVRAIYQNLRAGETVSGFSTITQQVARNLLLSPEERSQQTVGRKIKEVVLAVEIERRYPKEQLLEIYLNENNYGHLAYGIDAAARTYFQKSAAELNLAEASLLAGLPQSPSLHDPFINPQGALQRQKDVLRLMVEATQDGNLEPGVTAAEAEAAAQEMAGRIETLTPPRSDIPAPHFVQFVRQQVEAEFGPDLLYRGTGLRVYTTLDHNLQAVAEEKVRQHVTALAERNVTNGALVAMDPNSGEILAMVGSVDFNDESIDGQVNVALRCRQPGSSIKPLTFLAAFERGWTPSTLIWDVRTEYPNPPNPPYVPVNYDERYHGNVLLRSALANSYNVPAVKALEYVGVPGLLEMTDRLGVVSLQHPEQHCPEYPYDTPPVYGLSLTLGGGETTLLEMTGAYAVLANEGIRVPPTALRYIESADGTMIADFRERPGGRVVSPQHAYLITNILSDYDARCPAFGCPNTLELDDRLAAAKTGTTNDYRDAWTIGYTPELATGVWVGNSDNTPMNSVPGSRGAGPIWKSFMSRALANVPPSTFQPPPGIIQMEICADSGTQPSPHCPNRRTEIFNQNQPPPDASQDLWQAIPIDTFSGLRANELCPEAVEEKVFFVVPPQQEAARQWAIEHGYEQPPEAFCTSSSRPVINITSPLHNETIPQGKISVRGQVQMPNFDQYQVTYGVGTDPQAWGWISGPHMAQVSDGELTVWDTTNLAPGLYTLRVTAFSRGGDAVEARTIVNVAGPTPTPTATREPPGVTPVLPTPPPTYTPTPTSELPPTETPTPEPSPTPTVTSEGPATQTSTATSEGDVIIEPSPTSQ